MTSSTVGCGCSPSIPVNSDAVTVPGTISHERSNACCWPPAIQPASAAACSDEATKPAATTTSTAPVTRKNRARSSFSPPR